ncbi:MAG: 2-keto-3-deoxy-galactonokinase [Segetibacter sp.]|nr:2-keto-3-deoxy-galactonokinase [Segetibacter sp.]
MEKLLLGCDWGTSSFRLRLFDTSTQDVIGEVQTADGIAKMNSSWQEANTQNNTISKTSFFRQYLKEQMEALSAKTSVALHNLSIVISGMASSTIGMEDVPYAKMPFALDGSDVNFKLLKAENNFPNDIILISGVCSQNDVMRGEETQLIGLVALLEQSGNKLQDGVLIFPGTHSKHIHVKNGQLMNFNTFMTGEVFSIISNHSILKNSIEKDDSSELSETDVNAFKSGVRYAKETGILNGLFTVRTNQLFDKLDKKQNAFYLSGLLIGEELKYLLKNDELSLALCSASNLSRFYELAIEELNLLQRTTIVPTELVDSAALEGQRVIFQKHVLNKQNV